jgi:hypothetical protein
MDQSSTYSLYAAFLFPVFQTREEYKEATGEDAPAWDPSQPVKNWFDPAARNTNKRTMLYDRVLLYDANGMVIPDANGKPTLDSMALMKEVAGQVNMLPTERLVDYGPGSRMAPIPCPLRELRADEELFFTFGGAVAIRIKGTLQAEVNAFLVDDRKVLYELRDLAGRMAAKLGVS